jgi:hypothetical protein
VLSLFLSGPAGASGALARGDELRELYEACFRETDASQGQISDACRRWDDLELTAKNQGLCLDLKSLDWQPCRE